MAKIAVTLENDAPGRLSTRTLAQGAGWTVDDVICTFGPRDRAFEERHGCFRIAVVVAGTFQCRGSSGRDLMTPGSLLLGNHGEWFECGHEHGSGDRCVSFGYTPELFERLAAEAVAGGHKTAFGNLRLPPVPGITPLVARVCSNLAARAPEQWEELAVQLAGESLKLVTRAPRRQDSAPANAVARVTRAVRGIDSDPAVRITLAELAQEAGLSAYHFLRVFERLTGVTPHQYVRRARLRDAATRLSAGGEKVIDIAFDCGFGDVTNFNHAFRGEFGMSPRAWRARFPARRRTSNRFPAVG